MKDYLMAHGRKRRYYSVDLELQDSKIAVSRMGSSITKLYNFSSRPAYMKNFGRFNCPKCNVVLYLGQKQHVCDLWLLLGQGLDRYIRELSYQHRAAFLMKTLDKTRSAVW